MTDDEIRERLKVLRRAGAALATIPLPNLGHVEVGDEIRFDTGCGHPMDVECEHDRILVVTKVTTLRCDGCGWEVRAPAEMVPPILASLVLCPRCMHIGHTSPHYLN